MPDPTTQSNYLQVASKHITLDWHLDFIQKVISGSVVHDVTVNEDNVEELVLDTADLVIESTEVAGKPVQYSLGKKHEVMGSPLHIPLPANLKAGDTISVKVAYKTTQDSTALQWLEKEQTQGKKFPYLFSQCQPIYARAMIPIQDSPSVKITYNASISAILPILMSAIRASPPAEGPAHDGKVIGKDIVTYTYRQPVPIPSYLIAIAAGNVRYKAFPKVEGKDWTSGVWAEPEMLDAAYYEFSEDTTKFLVAEEELTTWYRFGVYDLLVLPPSFPYGGMENACLTFVTPTLLTGDRSLVDVVVHELTHSYFGNGVTHADARHFWLNESWTTYMERLLLQVLHSPAERGFSYLIGSKALYDALKQFEDTPRYQRLIIDFQIGENPDDAYSTIAYDKGGNLLLHLERTLGGVDVFLPYVKDYVNTFIGKSITTEQWQAHLYAYFQKHGGDAAVKLLNTIDWNAWFYGEGLELPVKMEYDMTLAEAAYALAEKWDASRDIDPSQLDFKEDDLKDMSSNQKVVFMERLQSYTALPSSHVYHLAHVYQFFDSNNAEIRLRFYEVALLDPSSYAAKAYAPQAAKWVVGDDGSGVIKGRMKFCRPVFRAVYKVDKDLAVNTFNRFKTAFHPIARKLIEKDLNLAPEIK